MSQRFSSWSRCIIVFSENWKRAGSLDTITGLQYPSGEDKWESQPEKKCHLMSTHSKNTGIKTRCLLWDTWNSANDRKPKTCGGSGLKSSRFTRKWCYDQKRKLSRQGPNWLTQGTCRALSGGLCHAFPCFCGTVLWGWNQSCCDFHIFVIMVSVFKGKYLT